MVNELTVSTKRLEVAKFGIVTERPVADMPAGGTPAVKEEVLIMQVIVLFVCVPEVSILKLRRTPTVSSSPVFPCSAELKPNPQDH